MILNYSLAFKSLQIWRLVTNVAFIGGFSPNFLFFVLMLFGVIKGAESNAIALRRYAEFFAMIGYLIIILHIVNLGGLLLFGFQPPLSLAHELLYAMIYIDSKREPLKEVMLYFLRVKNSLVPYALVLMSILTGGSIVENIKGIIAGNIYYLLKDVLPVNKGIDILITPKFLVDLCEKYYYQKLPSVEANMSGDGGRGEFRFGTGGVINRGRERGNNNAAGGGFSAFQGRGTTVG